MNKMGQYHILANLDKKEYVNPHNMNCGAKQWEHYEKLGKMMYCLATCSPGRGGGDIDPIKDFTGRWVGDRVVVVGDYTEDGDIPGEPLCRGSDLYGHIHRNFADITAVCAAAYDMLGL